MRDGDGDRGRNRDDKNRDGDTDGYGEIEKQKQRSSISTPYIQFLEGRLQVKFIFDVPEESYIPYILKAFNRYLLNKCIN